MPRAILKLVVIAAAVIASASPGSAEALLVSGIKSASAVAAESVYWRRYRYAPIPYYYPQYRSQSLPYPPVYHSYGTDPYTGASQYRLPSGPYYTPH
jgi:hypothetical protein